MAADKNQIVESIGTKTSNRYDILKPSVAFGRQNSYNSSKSPAYGGRRSSNFDKSKKSMWNTSHHPKFTSPRYDRLKGKKYGSPYHGTSPLSFSSTDDSSSWESNDEFESIASDSSVYDSSYFEDYNIQFFYTTTLNTNYDDDVLEFAHDNNGIKSNSASTSVRQDLDEENKENCTAVKNRSTSKFKNISEISTFEFTKRSEKADNIPGDFGHTDSYESDSTAFTGNRYETGSDDISISSASRQNVSSSSNESSFEMSGFKGRPSSCVFVASLSSSLSDDALALAVRHHFKQWGRIAFVKVLRDPSNRPYAFVQYTTDDDAKKAIREGQHSILNGRTIRCEKANVNRTLYLSTFSDREVTKKEISDAVASFGELENLVSLDGNDEYIELDDNDKSTIWFCKFVYRDDAINAYASLKENKKFNVHWAKNVELEDDEPDVIIDNFSVFVGQLDHSITKEKLIERFKRHGQIKEAVLVNRPTVNFAFIKYKTEAGAAAAVERENHSVFKSRTIQVQYREMFKNKKFKGAGCPKLTLAPPPVHFVKRLPTQRSASFSYYKNVSNGGKNKNYSVDSTSENRGFDHDSKKGGSDGKRRSLSFSPNKYSGYSGLGIHDGGKSPDISNETDKSFSSEKNPELSTNGIKDGEVTKQNNDSSGSPKRQMSRPRSTYRSPNTSFSNENNKACAYFPPTIENMDNLPSSGNDHGYYPPQVPYYFYIAPPSKEMQSYTYGYDGLANLASSGSNGISPVSNPIPPPSSVSLGNSYYYPTYPVGPMPQGQFDPNISPRSMEYLQIPPYYMYYGGPSYQQVNSNEENYIANYRESDDTTSHGANPKTNVRSSTDYSPQGENANTHPVND